VVDVPADSTRPVALPAPLPPIRKAIETYVPPLPPKVEVFNMVLLNPSTNLTPKYAEEAQDLYDTVQSMASNDRWSFYLALLLLLCTLASFLLHLPVRGRRLSKPFMA
jgi:hypothetical protein